MIGKPIFNFLQCACTLSRGTWQRLMDSSGGQVVPSCMNDAVLLNHAKVSYLDVVQVSTDDRAVHHRNLHQTVESQTCYNWKIG